MAAIVVNDGLDQVARRLLGLQVGAPALYLGLFANNVPIAVGTRLADLAEIIAPGYAGVPLTIANWAGGTNAGLSQYSYPVVTFTFTAGAPAGTQVFGYFVSETTTELLMWAENLPVAFPVLPAGGTLSVTLVWQDKNC
jgi:hypothetical protein